MKEGSNWPYFGGTVQNYQVLWIQWTWVQRLLTWFSFLSNIYSGFVTPLSQALGRGIENQVTQGFAYINFLSCQVLGKLASMIITIWQTEFQKSDRTYPRAPWIQCDKQCPRLWAALLKIPLIKRNWLSMKRQQSFAERTSEQTLDLWDYARHLVKSKRARIFQVLKGEKWGSLCLEQKEQ